MAQSGKCANKKQETKVSCLGPPAGWTNVSRGLGNEYLIYLVAISNIVNAPPDCVIKSIQQGHNRSKEAVCWRNNPEYTVKQP